MGVIYFGRRNESDILVFKIPDRSLLCFTRLLMSLTLQPIKITSFYLYPLFPVLYNQNWDIRPYLKGDWVKRLCTLCCWIFRRRDNYITGVRSNKNNFQFGKKIFHLCWKRRVMRDGRDVGVWLAVRVDWANRSSLTQSCNENSSMIFGGLCKGSIIEGVARSCKRWEILFLKSWLLFSTWREYF